MPRAQLAIEHNDRSGTHRQTCINLVPERTPQGPREYRLMGRPALVTAPSPFDAGLGAGPIRLLQQIGPVLFTLSGNTVYQDAVALGGTVAAGGITQAAFTTNQSVIVAGYNAYVLGASVTLISDVDLPDVVSVVYNSGYYLFAQRDSGVIWYSAFDDATDIDSLDFFTAEALPDNITRLMVLADEVVVFQTNSIEHMRFTGNADLPFRRSIGRTQPWGCRSPYSIVALDGGLFFIGQDEAGGLGVFRTNGGVPQRISSPTVDKFLSDAGADITDAIGLAVGKEGNGIYIITTAEGSYAYSIRANASFGRTDLWQKWESYDAQPWLPTVASGDYLGDASGNLYTLDWDAFEDADRAIIATFSAFLPTMKDGRCDDIELECATGVSLASGQGSDAVAERRLCNNIGGAFGNWVSTQLGLQGDYAHRAHWYQNGPMIRPGLLMEFRITDPVLRSVFDVLVNEGR